MSISGNSGFQEPQKVSISDVINFQMGAKTLQASFAKALQEADTESVVIVNIQQPIQSNQIVVSNPKIKKNTKKKRTSLNQQIRDMIQRSIRASKYSKETRTDKNLENHEEEGMFVIDYSRSTHNPGKNRKDSIEEDNLRRRRKFDQRMHSDSYKSSLDKELEKENTHNLQKSQTKAHQPLSSLRTHDLTKKEQKELVTLQETYKAERIENKQVEEEVEKEDDHKETLAKLEVSMTTSQPKSEPTENILTPLSPLTTIAPASSISPRSIMSLPPDFFELFEKLVGVMTIQQNSSGITDITVVMHRPGSPLDKSEVLLQFFDTNPRSCNVELRGSPEAVHYFQKYHQEFVANFRESTLSLQLNIRKPSLLQDKKITRKKRDE